MNFFIRNHSYKLTRSGNHSHSWSIYQLANLIYNNNNNNNNNNCNNSNNNNNNKNIIHFFQIELEFKVLIFVEGGKGENPEKNPWSRDENQQQPQPTCDPGPQQWEALRTDKLNNAILSTRYCICEKMIFFVVVVAKQIIIKCQSSKEVP